ncbi:MAG: hypothetical protein ABIP44_02175 [Pseudoxanthomonas sp.]
MSGHGDHWQNAVAELFFSSLKKEKFRKRVYGIRELARLHVFDCPKVSCSPAWRHNDLDWCSSEAFELASA